MLEIAKNVKIQLIKTKKYKHVGVSFRFMQKYNEKYALANSAICSIIGEYTNSYKTKELMAEKKDYLYGQICEATSRINGLNTSLNVNFQFLNPRYTNGVNLKDQIDFIKESFNDIYYDQEILDEIKSNYEYRVIRALDQPSRLATNRTMQIIGQDNHLKYADLDKRYLLDKLDLNLVKEAYERMLNEATIYIYVIGDVEDDIVELFKDFNFKDREYIDYEPIKLSLNDYEETIEAKDMSQSYINIVYETTYSNKTEEYYKWLVADSYLCNVPNSLLFKEVREKRSLCYSIYSQTLKGEGLSIIASPISSENKDKVVETVDLCLKIAINQEYAKEELDIAKRMLVNSLRSTNDDAKSYIDFMHSNNLFKRELSIDDVCDLIMAVSQDDVTEVLKTYKRRLVYLLKGENKDARD